MRATADHDPNSSPDDVVVVNTASDDEILDSPPIRLPSAIDIRMAELEIELANLNGSRTGVQPDEIRALAFDAAESRVRQAASVAAVAHVAHPGAALLHDVEAFLARYVVYPTEHARVAHALWIAHAWMMRGWESTPRIAFLSPEPGSGKSRALEVTEYLVPRPVHAVNVSPSYLFRKVSDPEGAPTILFDEIDTVFGPKAKDNEDVRGLLNAGHRKGAVAGRCVVKGKVVETEELPAYCAVAMAGLDDLPDTLMTRSVIVRMRRRAPGEHVEPWRARTCAPEAEALARRLTAWAAVVEDRIGDPWPSMPLEVTDRDADVWEALISIADLAGDEWPDRARVAAVAHVAHSSERTPSLGILLLSDLRTTFEGDGSQYLSTERIIAVLNELDESPWGDLRGKPLDARGLSRRLHKYGVGPKDVRVDGKVVKGYDAADLHDPWTRYLTNLPTSPVGVEGVSLPPHVSATSATSAAEPDYVTAAEAIFGDVLP